MNPESAQAHVRRSRAGTLLFSSLLLLAGLAAAPSAEAAPCATGSAAQRVACLVGLVVENPGCMSDESGDTCLTNCYQAEGTSVGVYSYSEDEWGSYSEQYTCATAGCEGAASAGTFRGSDSGWSPSRTENCFYSTSTCAVERWTETNSGRTTTCLVAQPGVSFGPCPDSGDVGQVVMGTELCASANDPIFTSCSGSDYGLVLLGAEACTTPPTVGPCPSGSYGVLVNGDGDCHTVGVCTSNPYGVQVDGSGCVSLTSCGGGRTGYKVNGDDTACVGPVTPPTVAPCTEGYGVVVNGDETCYTAGVCSGETGVHVNGHCYDVVVCTGSQVGARVDGTGSCVANPVGSCPNGRKGVVVAGQEICPVP